MRALVRSGLTAIIVTVMAGAMALPSMAQQRFEQGWRFAPPPGVTLTDQKPRHALMLQGNARVHPQYLRQVVRYATNERSGTIVVDTRSHFLYFVLGDGRAQITDLIVTPEQALAQIKHLEEQHRSIEEALADLRKRYYLMSEPATR